MPPSQKSSSTHYDSNDRDYNNGYRGNPGKLNAFDLLVKLPILLLMLGFGGFFIITGGSMEKERALEFLKKIPEFPSFISDTLSKSQEKQREYEATAVQDSYYVKSLGRSCDWNDEYDCYYDEETDCYFWYNNTTKTHTWQYWYEGISSDFGDYGWMEWDKKEQEWLIEEYDGEWIILPEEYDRSRLWHVE